MITWIIAIFIGLSTAAWYYLKHRNIPPGPRGLPFLGYAPFLGVNPQDKFLELGKTYGKIFSVYMGPKLAIVLNDYEAIKAAYIDQPFIFAGRADGFVFKWLATAEDGQIHGLAQSEGEVWKTSRRFALQALRDLGMGKSAIQDRILEEAEYLASIFRENAGKPFDPNRNLIYSVNNVICALCYGKRYPHDHPVLDKILSGFNVVAMFLAQAGPLQAYPILRFLPTSLGKRWGTVIETLNGMTDFNRKEIAEHRKGNEDDEPRDYIDHFLNHQKKEMFHGKVTDDSAFSDYELEKNLRAFFGAGTETTSTTLLWLFLYMIHHPQVQVKVQQEIDDNIPKGISITVEDRAKLPYTEAVIRECQRLGNVTPFGVLRTNTEETTLLGYRIPERSYIMPNFASVNLDPKLWKNPTAFEPERFLDKAGKVFEPPHFMPFSIGKRACVGESLARMEVFLFFANIMQRFVLDAPKGSRLPRTDEYVTGISCRPLPFQMNISIR